MAELTDIVYRNLVTTSRIAASNITAGAAVYLTVTNNKVDMTQNQTCGNGVFEGVALQTVSANERVSIAVPPSEVYVAYATDAGLTGTAGMFLFPSTTEGTLSNYDINRSSCGTPVAICGKIIEATSSSKVLARLMEGTVVNTSGGF